MVYYSVMTPVKDEEKNIKQLFLEVKEVMDSLGKSWEFVFVNDGSSDKSLDVMLSLKEKNVKIVDLRRNYGQAIAMDSGFKHCDGDIIITLDADLQNDPKDIPRLLKKLEKENLDVVAGWRKKRKDPFWMIFITSVARFLRSLFASDGVRDSGCTLRVYRREWVEDLELWGEMHRFIMAILRWKGAKVSDLRVNHRRRVNGCTKYNWKKSYKGFLDLFYVWFWKKFSSRPLHLFGLFGLGTIFLSFLCGVWTLYLKLFNGVSLSDSVWFVMSFFLFMIGFQFFIFGVILDIIIRNYYNTSREKKYSVKRFYTAGKSVKFKD